MARSGSFLFNIFVFFCLFEPTHFEVEAGAFVQVKADHTIDSLWRKYQSIRLDSVCLSFAAFEHAYKGFLKLKADKVLSHKSILAIADMTQSANAKRLYLIDIDKDSLLLQSFVAHGRNSGQEFATTFSNVAESYQSSVGFYITGDRYQGKHGLSLRLCGVETDFNDSAEQRAIVIHGADYVSETFIKNNGRLGRSLGCPAVSLELCSLIVGLLEGGTCFFIYYPSPKYLEKSLIRK
jgi:hypothetical protein